MSADTGLELRDVRVSFSGLEVLRGVSFRVNPGEVVGLVGPNAAGKSTLLNAVNGATPLSGGAIQYSAGTGAHTVGRASLSSLCARTFQEGRLFGSLTAVENILIEGSRACRSPRWLYRSATGPPWSSDELAPISKEVLAAAEIPANVPVDRLSFGQRRLVEFLRAVNRPRPILLLDEPFAGLDPSYGAMLAGGLKSRTGLSGACALVVEHDLARLEGVCDRILLLSAGSVVCEGRSGDALIGTTLSALYLDSR